QRRHQPAVDRRRDAGNERPGARTAADRSPAGVARAVHVGVRGCWRPAAVRRRERELPRQAVSGVGAHRPRAAVARDRHPTRCVVMKRTPSRPSSVLIVDDEPSVQKFVQRVLSEAGYLTAIAGDGPEALEAAAKMTDLDLLVTDLMMPQMSG